MPEARLVVIKPYEANQLRNIEDAIRNSDLGVNPTNDGNVIRIAIPQLTEERRRDLVKQAKSKGEDAKVSVRNIRRKAMEELHRIKKDGEAGEDEVGRAEKDLDKTTHTYTDPDRRPGQAQRRRAAGGLVADQQATPVADTDPVDGAAQEDVPGRPQSARRDRRRRRARRAGDRDPGFRADRMAAGARGGDPVATHEVVRRLREAGYALPSIPLLVGGQAMIWLTWPFGPAGLLGAYGGTIVVCMVWRLVGQACASSRVNYLRDISATVLLATWMPLFASFSALLIFQDHGGCRTFTVIVTVVFADIGGYVAGVLFGKHLMVPAISPKKSWEGLGGSLLFGITAAVLSVAFLLDKPAWVGVPLGLMLVITGVLGDLVESQVKRDLGIKDMGTLLPGHGGTDGPDRRDAAVGRRGLDRADAAGVSVLSSAGKCRTCALVRVGHQRRIAENSSARGANAWAYHRASALRLARRSTSDVCDRAGVGRPSARRTIGLRARLCSCRAFVIR